MPEDTEMSTRIANRATMSAKLTVRVNLGVQHLLAASRFSREVGRLEQENAGKPFGAFWEEILHNAIACVFTAVASSEAYANELFSDRAKLFSEYSPELLNKLWEISEQKPILEKFEFALLLLKKPPMDRGSAPYQDMRVLVELRNALTHFKPEWENEADEHEKISAKLGTKIKGSDFLSDRLLFPRRWATHDCTSWAVTSVMSFASAFENLGELQPRFAGNQDRFKP